MPSRAYRYRTLRVLSLLVLLTPAVLTAQSVLTISPGQ
jgi:hypothetical protein